MALLTPILPLTSHGPDRFRGSLDCLEHHAGVRTGISDWCCCCDPCLYERPVETAAISCRCVPQLICCIFTPDSFANPCARVIVSTSIPSFETSFVPGPITYTFSFGLDSGNIVLTILESVWRLVCTFLGVDQSVAIDHVNVTCLQVPAFTMSGVSLNGITGTIAFSELQSSKLPFQNQNLEFEEPQEVTYGLCGCAEAAHVLCVTGRRHVDGPVESVEFTFTPGLDRWTYLPPCGDPTLDNEVIYLRGDDDGNCWLEFDFEQTGDTTNDWADPPNTFNGSYPNEVREGMVQVNQCTCGLFVQSETTGERFVTITGGRCSPYRYVCGNCRCVPTYLCVFGEIDGEFVESRATFVDDPEGYGWILDDFPIRLSLVVADCPFNDQGVPIFSDSNTKGCAIEVTKIGGDFTVPFKQSGKIRCGYDLGAEVESEYDPDFPTIVNWLWISSNICGQCAATTCGECPDRCGANPLTLFVDLHAEGHITDDPDDPIFGTPYNDTVCDLTVQVHYFQRWDETTRGTPKCGYIGYSAPIVCEDEVFRIKVYLENFGIDGRISRQYLSGPVFDTWGPTGFDDLNDVWKSPEGDNTAPPMSGSTSNGTLICDPFFKMMGISNNGIACLWGCNNLIDTVEVAVYE